MLDTALPSITPSNTAPTNTSNKGESVDQIRRLGEKVEKTELPDLLKQNLLERVSRLALIRASSGFMSANYILEYENTATYINWIVGLPWHKQTTDTLDLVKAKQIMDKNHY